MKQLNHRQRYILIILILSLIAQITYRFSTAQQDTHLLNTWDTAWFLLLMYFIICNPKKQR